MHFMDECPTAIDGPTRPQHGRRATLVDGRDDCHVFDILVANELANRDVDPH